ncbi:C-terminal processing peptidase [Lachnospiraceae bacterium 2_1_46FAA]|nr:C-terminal processing peptidase [Lachnospiraceae bacterium 2_1_46FAA]
MGDKRGFLKGVLCGTLVTLVVAGAAGMYLKNTGYGETIDKKTARKLEQIKDIIDDSYLKGDEIKESDLENFLLKGYVNGLKDPYSVYYNEEETKELYETTEGEYSGIGAVMSQNLETGVITMVNVYEDSPAEKAGFKNNDILYKVNGKDISTEDISKVVNKIKGEEGTEVTITVLRDGKEYEATTTREKLEAHTIEYEMKEDHIGYVRVTEFDMVTYNQFVEAITDLKKQGMKEIIIDLRGNPGGNLSTVCQMLDYILPEGLIVYTEDKDGKREVMTSDEEHKLEMPMTVLVDGRSASASEIFAGAIQDYQLGTLVGTTTYGKGVVQQLFDLKDGTCLKLTIAEYFTPKGRNIHEKGIKPDVEVEYQYDKNNADADNQLDKAIEVLKEKMK